MLNMPIYNFWLIALIAVAVGVSMLTAWIVLKVILKQSLISDMQNNQSITFTSKTNETCNILTQKSNKTKRLQWALRIIHTVAIFAYIVALMSIVIYSTSYHTAKKYGAYDAFERVESIGSIKNITGTSFVEQSAELPATVNALKGAILVFYKYNCKDCISTKQMIVDKIAEYPDAKVYFISSRSDRGHELVETFQVKSVPSAVYVSTQYLEGDSQFDFSYCDFFAKKDDGTAQYDTDGHNIYTVEYFAQLLQQQQTEK